LGTTQAGQKLPVQIVLKEQFDKALLNNLVDGMPKPARRVEVARILKEFSAGKQAGVLGYLATAGAENVKSFWVVNAVYCEATPEVISALARRPEVNYVNYDLAYCPDLLEPEQKSDGTDEVAWGVDKINAPAVWALGYTGQNVVCGHIDTGCNYDHPDLADHMWTDANYPHHGWNFESNNNDPMDVSGHGTHTSGTVAGDGTGGTQTGVAPDAQIMVCRVRTQVDTVAENQMWAALQFVVSPPLSPSHGADLYTMSLGWRISWGPHQATWRTTADNVNAAGVSQIVAAGNERGISIPNACRCPGNVPPPWWNPENTGVGTLSGVVSIGATDASDVIADFSSPGPVTWSSVPPFSDYPYPPGLTRPDVSAPGVDVKSCSYTGGYALMSGTSMATPHTAGTVCLMLSKNPNLSPATVDSILELTAVDLGPGGKDNDFGAGRIDALAAVNYVSESGEPVLNLLSTQVIDSTGNNNGILDPSETAKLLATLHEVGGEDIANVTGKFRAYDARLTVSDSTGAWGDIPAGGSATNTSDWFTLHADGAIPPGTQFTCSLFVHGDADYDTKMPVLIAVGVEPRQPGEIIWGPLTCPGMPVDWGLYGVSYNSNDNLIYCSYMHQPTLYKYSSDSTLTLQGTVTLPNDSCTDLDYITYDDAFWVVCNPQKIMYKITPTGTVLSQFSLSFMDYPCGVTENEAEHKLYISDRRTALGATQLIYVTDTAGNVLDTITHPLQATYGTRCLALDGASPSDPPSLLNIYTWFDASGTILDSCGMYEIDRENSSLLNGYVFPTTAWNIRGIECDPRDGSYWITIMQGGTTENMIFKVVGFNYGTGIEEPSPELPGARDRLVVRAQPNPFTRSTNLSVRLPAAGSVNLKVYDNNGRVVRTFAGSASVGTKALFPWDGRNERGQTVPPGIYFYRVKSATAEAWGKVVLSR
jgi:serine protease AprX